MKRAIALLMALLMMFALCGCGTENNTKNVSSNPSNASIGFSADKIETKEEMDDMISVEEVKVERGSTYGAKIRNNYNSPDGNNPNRIMLQFQLLDKQGDVLETSYLIYEGLDYGQGGWSAISTGTDYSKVGSIKFVGYTFQYNSNNINDPSKIYGMEMRGGGNFTTPIVIPIENIEIVK